MTPCAACRRVVNGRDGGYGNGVLRRLLPLLVLFVVAGCPRDVQEPDDPGGVPTCETVADCNDRTCGLLRACVDGLCEREEDASLVVPCLDAGR